MLMFLKVYKARTRTVTGSVQLLQPLCHNRQLLIIIRIIQQIIYNNRFTLKVWPSSLGYEKMKTTYFTYGHTSLIDRLNYKVLSLYALSPEITSIAWTLRKCVHKHPEWGELKVFKHNLSYNIFNRDEKQRE